MMSGDLTPKAEPAAASSVIDSAISMETNYQVPLVGVNGEYTFTETELHSILNFMEAQNKTPDAVSAGLLPVPTALACGVSASPGLVSQLPMQFLPPSASQPLNSFVSGGSLSFSASSKTAANPPLAGQSLLLAHSLDGTRLNPKSLSLGAMTATATPKPAVRSSSTYAASASALLLDPKLQASHSTVEKQRRDRINNLIDELRELVPPQNNSADACYEGMDPRRPKHVVLSDTIAVLKKLQNEEARREASKTVGIEAEGSGDSSGHGARNESMMGHLKLRNRAVSDSSRLELPVAPIGHPNSNGIVVEETDSTILVRVCCRDRIGLLSDVTRALIGLNLQIKAAAVTTTADGTVNDVFEVERHPDVSQEDIQCHVHAGVYKMFSNKRLRELHEA